MPWLKLTDALLGHRKTRRLLRRGKNGAGLAAFGLHVAALLHCSEYLTDGYVEPEFVEETLDDANVRGKQREDLVGLLVKGGQWKTEGEGWSIHDYLDHNPSRQEVLDRRAKDADRKARGRSPQSGPSPRGQGPDAPRTPDDVPSPSDGPVPTQARPDPLPTQPVHQSAAAREHAPEILNIETALSKIGQRLGLIAPTADEIAAVVGEHPDRDPAKALAELQEWARRREPAKRPKALPGAFLHCLSGAPERPPSSLPVAFTEPAAADLAGWEAARTELRARVPESAFDVWLEDLTLAGVNDGTLVLAGPKEVVDWVSQRYTTHIAEAAGRPVLITAQDEAAGEVAA